MKTLLFLLLLSTLSFGQKMQIIVGSYSTLEGAKQERDKLNDFIQNRPECPTFIEDKAITIKHKPFGEYFIVTFEPIDNLDDVRYLLTNIKEVYPDAYTLKLPKTQSSLQTKEPIKVKEKVLKPQLPKPSQEISNQTLATPKVTVHVEEKEVVNNITVEEIPEEINLLDKYFIVIFIVIFSLTLVVLYFSIKSFQHRKKEPAPLADLQEEEPEVPEQVEEVVEEEKIVTHDLQSTVDDIQSESLSGNEEGSFGVDPSQTATQDEKQEELSQDQDASLRSKKREVPPHGKISKAHFQEFAGLRILVAEDNLINQKVIKGLLADTGIEIVMADDGQEALDILQKDRKFTFVLMDAHMPRVDGFEATQAIRANPNYEHILVVALSGDTAADDIKKMQNAGMQEHLEKPLRMDALYDIFYEYTDPDAQDDSQDQDYVKVVMTSELNGENGLHTCGGDEEFYREILNEFLRDYSDSAQKIHKYLQAGDIQHADKLLLDIIGITANIGADILHQFATDLKDTLKDTQEKSYLTLADQYEKHLRSLLQDIKNYLV